MFIFSEERQYSLYWDYFDQQPINPENFTTHDILRNFSIIFKNKDYLLGEDIWRLEDSGTLDFKEKICYNYLLIKKSALGNLRELGRRVLNKELDIFPVFLIFLLAIVYIGKGSTRRDLDHIREAIRILCWNPHRTVEKGSKLGVIMDEIIYREGIIIVSGFHDSSHYLAHSREAAMIDFFGVDRLTNEKRGTYYGESKDWSHIKQKNFGLLALFSIFRNFLNDGSTGLSLDTLHHNPPRERSDPATCLHEESCCVKCNKIM